MTRISFSGGADSTALAILLHDRGEEIELVFADTGAELPETYWIIPRVAWALNAKLTVVSGPTMFQKLAHWNFFLPGFRVRWCTSELKRKPLNDFFKIDGGTIAIGIRAEPGHPFDVFGIPVVMVAGNAAMAAILCGEIRPLVFDVAFHLRRRRGRAPEKTGWKF